MADIVYADILPGEYVCDDDIRQDGDTWTVCVWVLRDEEIPGLPSKELALAVVRCLRATYNAGADDFARSEL